MAARVLPLVSDPVQSAKAAGLHYRLDEGPGYTRERRGEEMVYLDEKGREIKDSDTLRRVKSLALPPAWTDIWISPDPDAHLQAVGRDAKGRKQYRYHPEYRHARDHNKFGRMLAFGAALKKIRAQVEDDLKLPGMPKQKVLATVVKLLESTCIRIGNDEYARDNDSYGLTTMKDKHVKVEGSKVRFQFRGKSGKEHDVQLEDPKLARVVKQCRDIPGYELFQYYDEAGDRCRITSTDVNQYLRDITGEEFTAKDFRTWGGTGMAAIALEEIGEAENDSQAKKNIVEAVKKTAERLGNRPATCRKYYVHPAVLDAYTSGALLQELKQCRGSNRVESCVLKLVEKYVVEISSRKKKSLVQQMRESVRKLA
jgi:DNA topoisomerase I